MSKTLFPQLTPFHLSTKSLHKSLYIDKVMTYKPKMTICAEGRVMTMTIVSDQGAPDLTTKSWSRRQHKFTTGHCCCAKNSPHLKDGDRYFARSVPSHDVPEIQFLCCNDWSSFFLYVMLW